MEKVKNYILGSLEELDKSRVAGTKDNPQVYDVPVDRDWAWVILFSPLSNWLCDRYTHQKVIFVGGLLTSSGLILP